ncbi:uroporphyrinogen-III synthase [Snodgrassella sp. CS2]|uniref:uroporphyrinogen-III synthase n=1 Tax=Snodgrassella sp. CS2 TaxID=3418953 RepID=UPI003D033ACC
MITQPSIALMRPRQAVAADIKSCIRAGWQPLLMEYQQLLPFDDILQQLAERSLKQDVIVWVSPSAVHIAAKYLVQSDNVVHVAVGAATAKVLIAYGFKQVVYPFDGNDSEAVLRLAIWHQQNGRMMLIRGVGGRELLVDKLGQQGWQVELAEVYKRQPQLLNWSVLRQPIKEKRLKAVYMTTSAAVNAWFSQMPPDLYAIGKSLLYLVHHPRVEAALSSYDVTTMLVSDLQRGLEILHSDSTV